MTMNWEEAFDGPLADEIAAQSGNESVRLPWPTLEDVDRDLADLVLESPSDGLKAARNALSELGHIKTPFRVYDLPDERVHRVGKYGSAMLGKLLAVKGEVVDIQGVQPCARTAAFECYLCGTLTRVPQPGGDLIEPAECMGCENDGGMSLNIGQSEVVDFQYVLLKRANSSMDDPPVETVFLWEDLCEKVSTGDVVTIVGEYDVLPGQKEAVLETYLDAVSINKSEQPATVDEIADWRVKEWAFDAADELCDRGSKYDCAKRDVIEYVADEHGVADGEVTAALADLERMSYISERRSGRVHITTSSKPSFEPDA